ncbi:MAG: hypothetical protein GF401_12865 [Chitinivibrionales bacterium]|nr:hypothetical protein [Chitinivibrionales bacterium]
MLVVSVLFFAPALFSGKTFYAFDTLSRYFPWRSYSENVSINNPLITDPVNVFYPDHLINKDNKAPFGYWNSHIFCGKIRRQASNPLVMLLVHTFPVSIAHDLLLFIHLFLAGCFAFLFLSKIGVSKKASLLGAIAWMFNGYVMVWFEFETIIMMASTFPAILYAFELFKNRQSIKTGTFLLAGIAYAISIGNIHILIYQGLFTIAYIFFSYLRFWKHSETRFKNIIRQLILLGVIASCACIINLTSIINNVSIAGAGHRKAYSFNELFEKAGKIPARHLVTYVFPEFFGSPVSKINLLIRDNQAYNNFNEMCLYAGIVPIILCFLSLLYIRKRFVLFFLLSFIITLFMAMGTVLYLPLYKFVPGLDLSTPTRILYITGFCTAILASLTLDNLIRHRISFFRFASISIVFITAIILIVAFVQSEQGIQWFTGIPKPDMLSDKIIDHFTLSFKHFGIQILFSLLALGILSLFIFHTPSNNSYFFLIIILLLVDLVGFGYNYNTRSSRKLEYPATPGINFLLQDKSHYRIMSFGPFLHNSFIPFGIDDIGGYASFYPERYAEYIHLSQQGYTGAAPEKISRWLSFNKFGSPLINLINTRYILFPPGMGINDPSLSRVYSGEMNIFKNKNAFPRAFFVDSFTVIPNRDSLRNRLAQFTDENFKTTVILEQNPEEPYIINSKDSTRPPHYDIRLTYLSEKEVAIQIKTRKSGFLVLSDSFFPGWKAFVDNDVQPIYRANYIMRAIPIREGTHSVTLILTSTPRKIGRVVLFSSWILLFCCFFFWGIRKVRRG